eukprot:365671-Chlamydomonas_euryale.AAC.3
MPAARQAGGHAGRGRQTCRQRQTGVLPDRRTWQAEASRCAARQAGGCADRGRRTCRQRQAGAQEL